MKLQPFPFDQIRDGKKKIEVRLYDEKRQAINIGDIIEFRKEPEQTEIVKANVVGLLRYKTFADLANDFKATDFGHPNTDHLMTSIFSFYTKEQEAKYGVLGIRIKLI